MPIFLVHMNLEEMQGTDLDVEVDDVPVVEVDKAADDLTHPPHHEPLVKSLLHNHVVEEFPSTRAVNKMESLKNIIRLYSDALSHTSF